MKEPKKPKKKVTTAFQRAVQDMYLRASERSMHEHVRTLNKDQLESLDRVLTMIRESRKPEASDKVRKHLEKVGTDDSRWWQTGEQLRRDFTDAVMYETVSALPTEHIKSMERALALVQEERKTGYPVSMDKNN